MTFYQIGKAEVGEKTYKYFDGFDQYGNPKWNLSNYCCPLMNEASRDNLLLTLKVKYPSACFVCIVFEQTKMINI